MKVLCLIDSLGAGGAQRQLVGLATFLNERGYEIIVACYHDDCFYLEQLQRSNIPYIYLEKANNVFLRIWHIARYIRKNRPNVVISYLETPSICACIAKIFNRSFKLIVSERNTTQHTGWNERIRFNLFRVAGYVVPNAFSQEKYIKDSFTYLARKIVTIPNFVDLEYFTPIYKPRRVIPEIIVAASIWPSKNTLGFIDAIAILKENGFKFHVNWYGKSTANINYFDECLDRIVKLGITDFISLEEKTDRIKERYQDSDCLCLPSFYEGTPNVICEAMACGLPIICSDVCDNGRYVVEGENGFLFNPKDTHNIANAIKRMLSLDEESYVSFCKASRVRVEEMLSKKTFVESYIRLIEQ